MRLALLIALAIIAPSASAAAPPLAADVLPAPVRAALLHRQIPPEAVSIRVDNLASGETLLSWLDETPRNPASIMKLLTTLVALDLLGPAYTWHTGVYARGEIRDGTLHGDLLLRGSGDPFLVKERLWRLQRELRAHGVIEIDGRLLLDDSYFAPAAYDPAAFDREPLRAYNVPPSALLMNFKVVRFEFRPGANNGVDVRIDPPLPNLVVSNRLRLRQGPCRGYQRGVAIAANQTLDHVEFDGRFPTGCARYAMDRTVLDHPAYVYGLFAALWRESGGRLSGGYERDQVRDDEEPLFEFPSLALADVVRQLNKYSNNVMARQLLYTLGAELRGAPGTADKGRAVIDEWLRARGFEFDELKLDNGAGLSRDARMTAAHMSELLAWGWQSRVMPEFVASMPVAGLDGTLRRRMRAASVSGYAHMKTGSLDHVSSIAGYVLAPSGERYAVVVMVNHPDSHRGTGDEVQEAVVRWLRERPAG